MISHYDRRLGMSDACIERFKGLVDCGSPPNPALLRDVTRICEEVARDEYKIHSICPVYVMTYYLHITHGGQHAASQLGQQSAERHALYHSAGIQQRGRA
jgi:hypothetical protein